MNKAQTDNSHLLEKIDLRRETISMIGKDNILVLEAYSGDGVIWGEVKKSMPWVNIGILRIDKKPDRKGAYLRGDNIKFLKSIDLEPFDIIDLDAYGLPTKQLSIIFDRGFSGFVHCTFIQSGFGMLDNTLLNSCGYTKEMISKCPTLFCRNGMEKCSLICPIMGLVA